MEWLTEIPIAHRGLHGNGVPENSIPAFQAAIDAGYPIELDVRVTNDGVPVVIHDRELERLTEAIGNVDRVAWKELRQLRLAGTEHSIPRLGVVLRVIGGEVPVLVDLKNPTTTAGQLEAQVIDRLDTYDGPFAVQSFNPVTLAHFRKQRPEWPRGQLAARYGEIATLPWYQREIVRRLLLTWWTRPQFVGYRHKDLPYWPVTIHRKLGLPILAWTIEREEAADRVAPHVDNFIFEGFQP